MFSMKKITLFLVVVFAAFMFSSVNAQEKETKVVEVSAAKVESTRGASPHITTPKPVNDEVVVPKPAENDKARGGYCKVIVDNWTGYTIDVYVDGDYAGTIAAWDEGYTMAIAGRTKLYAQSVGGTVYWGPSYVDCNTEYTWKLTSD